MVKRGLVLGGMLTLFGAGIFSSTQVNASGMDISLSVDSVISISVPSSANITLTPNSTGAVFNSASINAVIGTNNPNGYAASMSLASTTITRNGAGAGETGIETLAANTSGYSESDFTVNKWGYKLTGDNYYPLSTTIAPTTWETYGPTKNKTHTITIGAKVDSSLPAGTYATTINFTAVVNPFSPDTLADYYRVSGSTMRNVVADLDGDGDTEEATLYPMQDMTPMICESASEGELQVVDTRDNKVYWILKAKDGNCWMTQNLDYDITATSGMMVSEDTDIAVSGAGYMIGSNTTTKDMTDENFSWNGNNVTVFVGDPGNYYYTDTWFSSDDCPGTSSDNYLGCNYLKGNANGKFSTTAYTNNGTHGHVGNYYNKYTAYLTTIANNQNVLDPSTNPANSICPAGWRLPISSYDNEIATLVSVYSNTTSNGELADRTFTGAPLYFTRSGYVNESNLSYAGARGQYITSSIESGSARVVGTTSSGFLTNLDNPNVYAMYNSQLALPVRCLAHGNKINITYDANGGTGTVASQTLRDYGGLTANNAFTKAGQTFMGWNTRADGTGTNYDEGTYYKGPSTTLYAKWATTVGFDEAFAAAGKTKDVTTDRYKMQDMNSSICSAVLMNQIGELVDTRDGTIYHVGKLKDGRCWLLDNLALDLTDTNVQANLTSATTNATDSLLSNLKTKVVIWTSGSTSNLNPKIVISAKDDVPGSSDYNMQGQNWKFGVYYNYCAVSATTYCKSSSTTNDVANSAIDIAYDICPAGWRMPTGGKSPAQGGDPDGGEAIILSEYYKNNVLIQPSINDLRLALHLPLPGYYSYRSSLTRGSANVIGYWHTTTLSSDGRYSDGFTATKEKLNYNNDRGSFDTGAGNSVRCIAK